MLGIVLYNIIIAMSTPSCFPRYCREGFGLYERGVSQSQPPTLRSQEDRVLQPGLVDDFDCDRGEICRGKYTTTSASAYNGILQSRASASTNARAQHAHKSALSLCDGVNIIQPEPISQDTSYRLAYTDKPSHPSKPYSHESGKWHEMVPSCMNEPTMCITGTETCHNFTSQWFHPMEQSTFKKVNISECNTARAPVVKPEVRHTGIVFGADSQSFNTETGDKYRPLLGAGQSDCVRDSQRENLAETNRQTRKSFQKGSVFREGDYNDIAMHDNDCAPASMHTVDYGRRTIADPKCGKGDRRSFVTRSIVDPTRIVPSAVDGSPMEVSERMHPKMPMLVRRSLDALGEGSNQAKITADAQRESGEGVTFGYGGRDDNTTYAYDFGRTLKNGASQTLKPAPNNNLFWPDVTSGTGKSTSSVQHSTNLLRLLKATGSLSTPPIDKHLQDNIGLPPHSAGTTDQTETQHMYDVASCAAGVRKRKKKIPRTTEFNFIRNYVNVDPASVHTPESKDTYKDTLTRGDRLRALHANTASVARAVAEDADHTHIHDPGSESRSLRSETADEYLPPVVGLPRTAAAGVKTALRSSPYMPMTRNLEPVDLSRGELTSSAGEREARPTGIPPTWSETPKENLLLKFADRPKPVVDVRESATVPERYFQMDQSCVDNWRTNYNHNFDKPGLRSSDSILFSTRPKMQSSQKTVICPLPYRSVIC